MWATSRLRFRAASCSDLLVPLDEDPVGGDDPLGGQEQGSEGVHHFFHLDAVAIGVALAPLQQVGAGAADLRLLLHAGRVGTDPRPGAGVELPDDLRERAGVLGALGAGLRGDHLDRARRARLGGVEVGAGLPDGVHGPIELLGLDVRAEGARRCPAAPWGRTAARATRMTSRPPWSARRPGAGRVGRQLGPERLGGLQLGPEHRRLLTHGHQLLGALLDGHQQRGAPLDPSFWWLARSSASAIWARRAREPRGGRWPRPSRPPRGSSPAGPRRPSGAPRASPRRR